MANNLPTARVSRLDVYAVYADSAEAVGVKPKSIKSFPSIDSILKAVDALPKPIVKPAPAAAAKKATRPATAVSLTKVQRAKLRAYVAKHNVKRESGAAWDVETMSDELRAVIGLPKKGG